MRPHSSLVIAPKMGWPESEASTEMLVNWTIVFNKDAFSVAKSSPSFLVLTIAGAVGKFRDQGMRKPTVCLTIH